MKRVPLTGAPLLLMSALCLASSATAPRVGPPTNTPGAELLVLMNGSGRVERYSTEGKHLGTFVSGLSKPNGMAFGVRSSSSGPTAMPPRICARRPKTDTYTAPANH